MTKTFFSKTIQFYDINYQLALNEDKTCLLYTSNVYKRQVYIIYTIAELQELLRMSHTTVTKLLYELDSVHGIGDVYKRQVISDIKQRE